MKTLGGGVVRRRARETDRLLLARLSSVQGVLYLLYAAGVLCVCIPRQSNERNGLQFF